MDRAMSFEPTSNTWLFHQVWDTSDKFLNDYKENSDLPNVVTDQNMKIIFLLLYAAHGNDHIANMDVNQFKFKVWTTIWKYGGEWERKLRIQDVLKTLSDDELREFSEGIFNHASNPSVAPSTGETGKLPYVDDQNVQKHKKGKLEANQALWNALDSKITDEFIGRFKSFFSFIAFKDDTVGFIDDDEEEIEDIDEDDELTNEPVESKIK